MWYAISTLQYPRYRYTRTTRWGWGGGGVDFIRSCAFANYNRILPPTLIIRTCVCTFPLHEFGECEITRKACMGKQYSYSSPRTTRPSPFPSPSRSPHQSSPHFLFPSLIFLVTTPVPYLRIIHSIGASIYVQKCLYYF